MRLEFDPLLWPGRNQPVFARHGAVATSQPLAAQAGLDALRRGGNAVDAAVAAAATLTVVEPASNGIGGDAFALVWDGERLHGLNGSGRAPAALTADRVRRAGHEQMPEHGWLSVTVPGAPAAWRDLHRRFGRLAFPSLFEPAVAYAEQGHPVSPISLFGWRWQVEQIHHRLGGPEFEGFPDTFTVGGRPPDVGELWRNPAMAASLRAIADTGADDFYQGELAATIAGFSKRTGGTLDEDDLAAHESTWVEPIGTSYRGHEVWELPPNGQGLAALIALNLLEGFDLAGLERESAESYHLQLEAMKLAFADAHRYVADPERAEVPTGDLLSKDYAAGRRSQIGERALLPEPGRPARGDTVYLCAADADGMMVSFIQSTYGGFGSHVVVPGTGVALQNRASGFSLDPDHPNRLEPGKRPYHTIIPGFLTGEDGRPLGPFGVMGGHMQPQGHVQTIVNTVDYGMDPQTSLDAPRWSWWEKRFVKLEPSAAALAGALTARGHDVEVADPVDWSGRGQIIWRLPSGAYVAGSDVRGDGRVAAY